MSRVDLWLDDDDIAAASVSNNGGFLFEIPADAVRKGNLDDPKDDKARASWTQRLQIVESKFYEDQANGEGDTKYPCITAEISFQVPPNSARPDGTPDPNSGKQHRVWLRVVPSAMKDKQHPKYKANNFALGKLNGILRSIWGSQVFPSGVKINLGEYFGGDTPPVIHQHIVAEMRASKWNGKRRDEVSDLVPLEMQ